MRLTRVLRFVFVLYLPLLQGMHNARLFEDCYFVERCWRGHRGKVTGVVIASDGSKIISYSDDKSIKMWDARSGIFIKMFADEEGLQRSLAFCRAAEVETKNMLADYTPACSFVMSSDKKTVFALQDNVIAISNIQSKHCIQRVSIREGQVSKITISPDGKMLVAYGNHGLLVTIVRGLSDFLLAELSHKQIKLLCKLDQDRSISYKSLSRAERKLYDTFLATIKDAITATRK